jgi:hypothetical protein
MRKEQQPPEIALLLKEQRREIARHIAEALRPFSYAGLEVQRRPSL